MERIYEKYLMEYGYSKQHFLEERVCTSSISFMKLRDILIHAGNILKEDFDNKIYIVSVKSGWMNCNNAVVICGLRKDVIKMVGFAKEGIFNQNTSKKAIDKIEELINDREIKK